MENTKDGTRVDLGDDLLEGPTRVTTVGPVAEPVESPRTLDQEIDDEIHSARILMQEGLFEDAKKILRKVSIYHPERRMPRHLLKEIQDAEIKNILGDETRGRSRRGSDAVLVEVLGDTDEMMRSLDSDLKLGVFAHERGDSLGASLSLFQDKKGLDKFQKKLSKDLVGSTVRERLDLAIAFHEMGLLEIAIKILKPSVQDFDGSTGDDLDLKISALGIYALSMIQSGHPYDATLSIQPTLRNSEIGLEKKIELLYLMGLASDSMKKLQDAAAWYEQAAKIDPNYRDLPVKLRGTKPRK